MEISSLIEPLFENFENPIVSMLAVSTVETIYGISFNNIFTVTWISNRGVTCYNKRRWHIWNEKI